MRKATHPIARKAIALAAGGLALLASLPLVALAAAEEPQITDAVGDLSPGGIAKLNLSVDTAEALQTLDLVKTLIASEGSKDFWLRMYVNGIDDNIEMRPAPPAGDPIAGLPGAGPVWDQQKLNDLKVVLSSYFNVRGQDYHVDASLYKFYVDAAAAGPASPAQVAKDLASAQQSLAHAQSQVPLLGKVPKPAAGPGVRFEAPPVPVPPAPSPEDLLGEDLLSAEEILQAIQNCQTGSVQDAVNCEDAINDAAMHKVTEALDAILRAKQTADDAAQQISDDPQKFADDTAGPVKRQLLDQIQDASQDVSDAIRSLVTPETLVDDVMNQVNDARDQVTQAIDDLAVEDPDTDEILQDLTDALDILFGIIRDLNSGQFGQEYIDLIESLVEQATGIIDDVMDTLKETVPDDTDDLYDLLESQLAHAQATIDEIASHLILPVTPDQVVDQVMDAVRHISEQIVWATEQVRGLQDTIDEKYQHYMQELEDVLGFAQGALQETLDLVEEIQRDPTGAAWKYIFTIVDVVAKLIKIAQDLAADIQDLVPDLDPMEEVGKALDFADDLLAGLLPDINPTELIDSILANVWIATAAINETIRQYLGDDPTQIPPEAFEKYVQPLVDMATRAVEDAQREVEDHLPDVDPNSLAAGVLQEVNRQLERAEQALNTLLTALGQDPVDVPNVPTELPPLPNPGLPPPPVFAPGEARFDGPSTRYMGAPSVPAAKAAAQLAQQALKQAVPFGLPILPIEPLNGLTQPLGAAVPAGVPKVVMVYELRLVDGSGKSTPLDGSVDVKGDFVQMRVPKALVGSPARGDALRAFWSMSAAQGTAFDFAPDGTPIDVASNPNAATSGPLVKPNYGRDYTFAHPVPGKDLRAPFELSTRSPLQQTITAGGVATYYVTIWNRGTETRSGLVSASEPAPGWSVQLGSSHWTAGPGQKASIPVTVTALNGAAGTQTTHVYVSSPGADTGEMTFTTMVTGGGKGGGGGGGKSPGLEAVGVLATLALLGVALGRRRRD